VLVAAVVVRLQEPALQVVLAVVAQVVVVQALVLLALSIQEEAVVEAVRIAVQAVQAVQALLLLNTLSLLNFLLFSPLPVIGSVLVAFLALNT
jgi:hypothetical protein